jgi:hypothetical protein
VIKMSMPDLAQTEPDDVVTANPPDEEDTAPAAQPEPAEGEEAEDDEPQLGDDLELELEPDENTPPPGYEFIDHDGRRFAVPKELKDSFLRQADYTRKTQEVADQRRAIEERAKALESLTETQKQDMDKRAKLVVLDEQVAWYEKQDWDKWQQDDFVAAQQNFTKFQFLKDQRNGLREEVRNAEGQRAETAQREFAKRFTDTQATLARDIRNWGDEVAGKLTSYGTSIGFTLEELGTMNVDARVIKSLHKAMLYDQFIAEQKAKRAKAKPSAAPTVVEEVKPLTTVATGRSRPVVSALPSDKDNDDEWLKKRWAQVEKRNKRT